MEGREPVDLLVCAATLPELRCFAPGDALPQMREGDLFRAGGTVYLLSGAGIPATFVRLLPALERIRPRLLLNIGIAGAYAGSGLEVGDIVLGESEVFGDIGFELPEEPGFRYVGDAPWGAAFYGEPLSLSPEADFRYRSARGGLPVGRGCTVNTCTGTEATGRMRRERFRADFETMEGAAAAQAGALYGIPVCEVRAISNIAARRSITPESIALALAKLTDYFHMDRERA